MLHSVLWCFKNSPNCWTPNFWLINKCPPQWVFHQGQRVNVAGPPIPPQIHTTFSQRSAPAAIGSPPLHYLQLLHPPPGKNEAQKTVICGWFSFNCFEKLENEQPQHWKICFQVRQKKLEDHGSHSHLPIQTGTYWNERNDTRQISGWTCLSWPAMCSELMING